MRAVIDKAVQGRLTYDGCEFESGGGAMACEMQLKGGE